MAVFLLNRIESSEKTDIPAPQSGSPSILLVIFPDIDPAEAVEQSSITEIINAGEQILIWSNFPNLPNRTNLQSYVTVEINIEWRLIRP